MDYIVVTTTTENEPDAAKIADALMEQHLAACVQIVGPIRSVYRWQGKVTSAEEYRCEVKTRSDQFPAICEIMKKVHPYEVPELIAVPLEEISPEYRQWLEEQLGNEL